MRRKSLVLALLAILALLGVVTTSLAVLVLHEPAYYKRGAMPPGKERHALSNQFLEEFSNLYNSIQRDDAVWSAQFTTEQVNSYLLEDFLRSGADVKMLPDNIHEPRVAIDADRLRLGFRYGIGRWSTIITVDVRLWVAQGEPNTVGLELLGLHAGALPINAQSLLEHVSEAARRSGVDVSWYRYEGHPVALLHFGPDQPRTTVLLTHVDLQPGKIVIQGRCTAPGGAPANTMAGQ